MGSNYSAAVEGCSFNENIATVSAGALSSTSLDVGNFTVRGTEFNHNSASQCGAVDLKADENNPNFQTWNGLNMKVLAYSFANNSAKEGREVHSVLVLFLSQ